MGFSRKLVAGLLSVTALTACSDNNSTKVEQSFPAVEELSSVDLVGAEVITDPVIVYSSRQEQLIKPLFDQFTAETGIEVQFQTGEEGPLLARLEAEGERTFADLLYTVDAGNLWSAAQKGLLSPVNSELLVNNIPPNLRDADGQWFALSVRARTIVYSTERVKPADLSSYAALADPVWKGRLCLRTSKKVYNMSLVAMMIERLGEEATQQVVEGWVENLATRVFSSDTLLLEAIEAGQCDIGLVNTYYLGREQLKDPDFPVAIFWANQVEGGVHVNISGAGVTRYAHNRVGAIRLLEWLSTQGPQEMFSELNLEFPANPSVKSTSLVESWGSFKQDPINVEAAGRLQSRAVMLMDRADYR